MKKTLLCFLAAGLSLILSPQVNAQSFLEDFATMSTAQQGLTSGGDTVSLPSGDWNAQNLSVPLGTTGWFGSTSTALAPSPDGNQFLAANFNATTGANTINSFFMSPQLTFNNGDTISFVTRNPSTTFPDRLRVLLSTSGASTDAANFTTTLLSINESLAGAGGYPIVWTSFNVTISGLGGPTSGRFAFNYNVTDGGPAGANSNLIGIDSVNYISSIPEPTSALALMGLCVATVLRRRRR